MIGNYLLIVKLKAKLTKMLKDYLQNYAHYINTLYEDVRFNIRSNVYIKLRLRSYVTLKKTLIVK